MATKYVVLWGMMFVTFLVACMVSPDEWLEYLIGIIGFGLFVCFVGWTNPDGERRQDGNNPADAGGGE